MEEYSKLVEKYKRFREINREFNNILTRKVSKNAIHNCGIKLGIMQRDTLVFEDEQEMDVLMDYCIYDYYENGQNAVSRYMPERQLLSELVQSARVYKTPLTLL